MEVTISSLVKLFYTSNRYGTDPTDLLVNCSQFPVVVQVSGKLHRIKNVTVDHGALVLVTADAEYKGRKQ